MHACIYFQKIKFQLSELTHLRNFTLDTNLVHNLLEILNIRQNLYFYAFEYEWTFLAIHKHNLIKVQNLGLK